MCMIFTWPLEYVNVKSKYTSLYPICDLLFDSNMKFETIHHHFQDINSPDVHNFDLDL